MQRTFHISFSFREDTSDNPLQMEYKDRGVRIDFACGQRLSSCRSLKRWTVQIARQQRAHCSRRRYRLSPLQPVIRPHGKCTHMSPEGLFSEGGKCVTQKETDISPQERGGKRKESGEQDCHS